ncbi:O-antigen polymerase [Alcanivorax hongdengensis A-11-3]|uniref:O-antigen polymerase n=1 Tax=Alcanivorax hongdengensis A-11-3 TaxID=1177179 RepID=L0W8J6_9GAMM|nr:O-antigen ligase family protein [Alcanivorax hongdengensis]EKF73294.1 O-antigen polymerase [Alcanivorax hongdengensis A-11-3]
MRSFLGKEIWVCFFLGVSVYLGLATGSVFPVGDDALFVVFIAFIYFFSMLLAVQGLGVFARFRDYFFLCVPVSFCLLVSLFRAEEPGYAIEKIEGAILITLIVGPLLSFLMGRIGKDGAIFVFLIVALMFLFLTVLYKAKFGFFDRSVRYFINGPIVYGWIMGYCAVLAIYLLNEGHNKKVLYPVLIAFVFAMLWTKSKGPVVAFSAVFLVVSYKWLRIKDLAVIAAAFALFSYLYSGDIADYFSRFSVFSRLIKGDVSEADAGSISARLEMLDVSLRIFMEYPVWGVGIGNWKHFSEMEYWYPHNIFFEILSEMGIVGLGVFLTVILYLFVRGGWLSKISIIYFVLCSSFSGDLSYLRFLLVFSMGFLIADRRFYLERNDKCI